MADQPRPGGLPKLPYRDDPSIAETFVDSFHLMMFDGAILRMEFTIQRFDEPKPPKPPSGHAKTAARLVMPAQFIPEVYNQLAKIIDVMAQKGMVTMQGPPPPATPKEKPN